MKSTMEIDKGYHALRREIEAMKKEPYVAVGFQDESGLAQHKGAIAGKPATVAEVATFNEFGTRNKDGSVRVPERSFVRATIDESRRELISDTGKLFRMMAQGRMTTAIALNILGLKIKSLIQKKITDLREPPNSPRTIAKKKSSNPLIDTGQMRQSVTHKVKARGD